MSLEKTNKDPFVSILSSDATFRLVVPEGTPDSVKREYEDSKGNKGVKNELVFNKMIGKITKIAFAETDFGKLLHLTITDDKGDMILSISTSQNYGEDMMKKIPNIDLSKEVTLSPYSFSDDKGKLRKGISVTQNGEKIKNFFYDEKAEKNVHGFPNPKGDTSKYSKDKWKIYFLEARDFLCEYIAEHFGAVNQKSDSPVEKEESVDDLAEELNKTE